jgi:hypothetical protein
LPADHHHSVKKAKKELRENAKQAAAARKNNCAPPPGSQIIDLEDPKAITNLKAELAPGKPIVKEETQDDESTKVLHFLRI